MQTQFTADQLADPALAECERILRKCVHCGFCTATCPTYVALGDERDSPRGRIYLIKAMLEQPGPPPQGIVRHLDRCLGCLSCMTTCPSGVDYMHLIDHAREVVEQRYTRPLAERIMRNLLAWLLPRPDLFRLSLVGGRLAKPFAALLPGRLKGMVAMAPSKLPAADPGDAPQVFPAQGARVKRVALMTGCAQKVLNPAINQATVRLLTRLGCEVVVADGAGCCGAITHHMGKTSPALAAARANVAAWTRVLEAGGLDAVVVNASGCGTTVKDYGHLLAGDPGWAEPAARIASLVRDVSEVLAEFDLAATGTAPSLTIAYHAACSLQHGQKITTTPKELLAKTGFQIVEPVDKHLCCGSAGTYNLLQPELSGFLKDRKVASLERLGAEVIATGNIGCLVHIGGATALPVVHTVELLDWATGGPRPAAVKPA